MIRIGIHGILFFLLLLLTGCTGMKRITSADPLFIGHEVSFVTKPENKSKLMPVINGLLKPEPNRKLLWMRPGLANYNMLSEKARNRKFWINKVTAPVLRSDVRPDLVARTIEDRMFQHGYFQNHVEFDTMYAGKRKIKYHYTIDLLTPYTISTVEFPNPTEDLTQQIQDIKEETVLHTGDIYTLDAVKEERIRIDRELKERGYIYFSPDFLLLKADTISGNHQVKAEVTIKPDTPPESRIPFKIGKIFVHDDHLLDSTVTDTTVFENFSLISRNKTLDKKALEAGLFLKPGELYVRSDHMHTVRYYNDLPIIRNANIKFSRAEAADELDVVLFLSQRRRFAYTAEFNTIFRSTNYFGPGIIFSYTDRNANRGAELLKINLRASFEMQIVDREINPAYELGLSVNYTLPRFYPFFLFKESSKSLPKTTISAGYNLFHRLDLYRLNSVNTNLRYSWSISDRIQHSFHPVEISFTKLPEDSKSEEFDEYLEDNPGVKRSFDEQLILGSGYEFTYQSVSRAGHDLYFRGGLDLAGNLANMLYTWTNSGQDSTGRYTLFGVPFSQYARPVVDLHYRFKINQRSNLASRFSTGVGVPIGNADVLPYIKQFYVGGTNSLRSFIARSLGPGSEVPPEGYNDVTGDIRIEGNVEYRFEVSGDLKGALFIDAGNIWLFNKDPSRPNGHFRFDTFLDQLAVSVGWGLRWDFDFIVARLDFAYTARTPYLPEGERWTDKINILKPAVSIAIGYPF